MKEAAGEVSSLFTVPPQSKPRDMKMFRQFFRGKAVYQSCCSSAITTSADTIEFSFPVLGFYILSLPCLSWGGFTLQHARIFWNTSYCWNPPCFPLCLHQVSISQTVCFLPSKWRLDIPYSFSGPTLDSPDWWLPSFVRPSNHPPQKRGPDPGSSKEEMNSGQERLLEGFSEDSPEAGPQILFPGWEQRVFFFLISVTLDHGAWDF